MKLSTKIFLPIILISALLISLTGCFGVPADDSPGFTPGSIKGTMARPEVCCGEPSESSLVGDAISPNVCDDLTLCDPQHMADWYAWANVEVTLTNWVDCEEVELASTMTDENGNYLFENVPAGKNYIITAICPEEIDFKVKDVAEEVVKGATYDAGIADAESTVLALCLEGLGEICLDSDVLSLNDFRDHFKYDKVICEVCDQLAECLYALPVWVCEITELCPGYTSTGGGDDDDDDDECESPTANAGPDQSEEVCPQTNASINLVGSGTGTPTLSYSWDFDASNGITVDSTEQSPSGVPFVAGTYTVTLTVTNGCGSATDTMTVEVTESLPPTANAGPDQSEEVCPQTSASINLVGSGTGTPTLSYSWDFDASNGITEDSAEQSPSGVPFGVGTYTVTLTVTDGCGDTETDTMTVEVTESLPPTAYAGPDQCIQLGCESEVIVDFDGSGSSGVCLNYDWDFDDGNYGTGSNPSHTYPAGTYDVTLTVTDICGRSDTDTMVLTIHGSCGNLPDQLTVSYSSPWTTNHYLKVKFSDGGGDILPDFQYYGWCSHLYEQGLPISGDVMYAYCTLELDKYWDKINYIINNRDGYGKMAVQWAIWHYIHNIDPDSSSSTVNSKAWELIDDADANGIGFCPGLGEKYVVLLTFFEIDTYGNLYKCHHEQNIMIEVDWINHCE